MALPQALQYIIAPPVVSGYEDCGDNVPHQAFRGQKTTLILRFTRPEAPLFHAGGRVREFSREAVKVGPY
jgi:N-acyl-D-aspartate/D-glutamate deacylase